MAHIDTKTSSKKNLYKSIMGTSLDFSMEKFSLSRFTFKDKYLINNTFLRPIYQVFDTGAYFKGQCHTMPQPEKRERILRERLKKWRKTNKLEWWVSAKNFTLYIIFKYAFKKIFGANLTPTDS